MVVGLTVMLFPDAPVDHEKDPVTGGLTEALRVVVSPSKIVTFVTIGLGRELY